MSTSVNVNVKGDSAGGVQDLLNRTVAANREELQLKLEAAGIKQTPEAVQEFARLTGQSIEEALLALSPDAAVSQQAATRAAARDGAKEQSTYRPDELSAQRNQQNGYPVAAFWLGSDSETGAILLRPTDPTEGTGEISIQPIALDVPESTYTQDVVNTDYSYTWTRTFSCYNSYADDIILWFPVSRTTCIVAYAQTGISYLFSGTTTLAFSREIISGTGCGSTVYAAEDTTTKSSTWASSKVDSVGSVRTFLVSPTAVNEINTPSAFENQMLSFLTRYDTATVFTAGEDSGISYEINLPPSTSLDEITVGVLDPDSLKLTPFVPPALGLPPSSISTEQSTRTLTRSFLSGDLFGSCVSGFTSGETANYTGFGGAASASDDAEPAFSYYDALRDPLIYFGCYNTSIRGPGATYVFLNPEAEVSDIPSERTPQQIKAEFFANTSVPSVSLGLNYIDDVSFRFDYIKQLFYPGSGTLPSSFSKNTFHTFLIPDDSSFEEGSFFISACWDWGRAGYCREQLYSLGFTQEDFTP